MLIEFSVGNFRSFKERVTLSLQASTDDWLEESHVATVAGERLLKSAAIFGANASGKSNLLDAMECLFDFVWNSSKESQQGDRIPVIPFRLSTATESEPSHFEVVFLQNGTRYRYGFEARPERVHTEWLFRQKDSAEASPLFTREGGSMELSAHFEEGKKLVGHTRSNALFLSVVAQFNGEIASEIMKWISHFRKISGQDDENYVQFSASLLEHEHYGKLIRKLTQKADVGIDDMKMFEVPPGDRGKYLPKSLPETVRKELSERPGFSVKTIHKKFNRENQECGSVEFHLRTEESAGTKKFVALSGPFVNTLEEGFCLVVDELEARFHPLLTQELVSLFCGAANRKNAQLIYATHNEGLLDPSRIRRDQVWFMEKDQFGASRLFSLAEFKVLKQSQFGKEYLLGQFGGIPHLGDFSASLQQK